MRHPPWTDHCAPYTKYNHTENIASKQVRATPQQTNAQEQANDELGGDDLGRAGEERERQCLHDSQPGLVSGLWLRHGIKKSTYITRQTRESPLAEKPLIDNKKSDDAFSIG